MKALPLPDSANVIDYDDGDIRGFAIRSTPTGNRTFVLVYVAKLTGATRRLVLGEYGPAPRLSISAGRERAKAARALVDAGRDPWQEAKDKRAAAEAAKVKSKATLGALMAAYVDHLKLAGKASAKEVDATVDRNITKPHPKIADLPVDAITVETVMPVFRKLTRAGKWRAAEKLAAHLRAAFNAAKASRLDAGVVSFAEFDVRANPLLELRVTRPDEGANGDREVQEESGALSETELRHYWKAINKLTTPHGAMMRFHLLTGGQRMEQLSRLDVRDWDHDANAITLMDTKGRRRKARTHVVPLLPDAITALEDMRTDEPAGPHLFSVSAGARAAVPHTLAAAMRDVSELLLDKELVSMPITPGTIRRTVETRLAAAKVSKDVRAHLQSHGLGGVQDRHYDRHSYLDEKRDALQVLRDMLDKPNGKVVPLHRAR
ncbi:integrase family protein [Lysobacter niastensis]|uniref:Integrase family protein n=1 Tax=Lysobacter niastensis TaxID=380629 RepID=A0ABS0B398_9GAMM|nr:integrase family protein [Lysobacter niastensis]